MPLILTDNIADIEKMVIRECINVANQEFPTLAKAVRADFAANFRPIFILTKEYDALVNGTLGYELGPVDPAGRMHEIMNIMEKSIRVDFTRFGLRGTKITGGLELNAFQADFEDILASPAAVQMTEKEQYLPWLEWLIIRGDKVIIKDYRFRLGRYRSSRTGGGLMFHKDGGLWRVPPEYSGTKSNNWFTRAIEDSLVFIENLISDSIVRRL